MLKYSSDEVLNNLESAKNINAALKKFLKNEVGTDAKSARFIKDLREIMSSKDRQRKATYIDQSLDNYEPHFLVLARYAYKEEAANIAEQVINKYSEEFNNTYEQTQDGINIKDKSNFKKIVLEASKLIEQGLKTNSLSESGFMKKVMLYHIFDPHVLREVLPIIEKS